MNGWPLLDGQFLNPNVGSTLSSIADNLIPIAQYYFGMIPCKEIILFGIKELFETIYHIIGNNMLRASQDLHMQLHLIT